MEHISPFAKVLFSFFGEREKFIVDHPFPFNALDFYEARRNQSGDIRPRGDSVHSKSGKRIEVWVIRFWLELEEAKASLRTQVVVDSGSYVSFFGAACQDQRQQRDRDCAKFHVPSPRCGGDRPETPLARLEDIIRNFSIRKK